MMSISKLLKQSSLSWTVVRFIAPKNRPYTGRVKIGFGDIKMSMNISREDIGAFMVEQVESKTYSQLMPLIGS